MDDELTPDNIILFIYSQSHYRKELNKFTKNTHIVEAKNLIEYKIGGKTHYIFYLILISDYNKEQIELEFEKNNRLYSSKIKIEDIYCENFLFKIDFTPKENENNELTKFTMDFSEQFKMFLKLKEEKSILSKLKISFSDEYLKNLCLSAIHFISSTNEDILTLDFLFNVFINCYLIQKNEENSEEKIIKLFFEKLELKSISSKNININDRNEDISKYKEYFSDAQKIQKELVEFGGKNNIAKINIILAYFYLKQSPKNFVQLISLNNNYSQNTFQNLKDNSKIFNEFSSEIINFKLLDEAENIDQIIILLKLLPNMVELFKIFLDMDFFLKLSNLSQIENKCIDVLEIVSPKITDDLDSLYNYFFFAIDTCESEGIVIFKLPDKFFLDYANFNAKKNLQNLKLIREMYEKYVSLTNINNKEETIESLNNLYYEAGLQLVKNDKNFINDEIINFFQESRLGKIKNITSDDVSKLIDLNVASEEFINNFLNNNFKKFDLKVFFGKEFDSFIQKIFKNFNLSIDFYNIKNWKISPNVNEEVLKHCIRRISVVLSQDKNMKSSFTDLINFLCNLFSFGSRKIDDFIEELKEVEQNIPSDKLIEVYFRILYKGEKIYPISNNFNKHLIKYIENNSGNGPLSVWYRLVVEESNERVAFLYKNLKPEFAVKKEHFIDYPNNIKETISLYTYLYFGKYFSYNYITELEYYKNSLKAKEELINLTYEQAEKIFVKYKKYYKLFKLFVPIKQFNEKNYNTEYTEFYKKLKQYKNDHDSLINIINYYKQFFSGTKNTDIITLQNLIDSINKSPLTQFYSQKEMINEYLKFVEIAKNRIKLINSIIFMEIYNDEKSKFKGQEEEELFNKSLEEFKKLKDINNIEDFNKEFKIFIATAFIGKINEIMKEINFIFSYFGLVEDSKLKANIKLTIEQIIEEIIDHPLPKPIDENIVPEPEPIIPPDSFLKDIKDISDNCIYFYNNYRNEGNQENPIIDNLNSFSDIMFKIDNQEKVKNSDDKSFLFIIKRMLIACLISFNYNTKEINDDNPIYLFKEFYLIYEVYKNGNNNDNSTLNKNLKNIHKSFCDRTNDEEYKDILNGLSTLFDSMENENEKKIKFTNCFLNILEIELEKKKIKDFLKQKENLNKFLEFILKSFPDDFIPLIDLLSNLEISDQEMKDIKKIEKSFNNNILFNSLEKYLDSDKFKDQILYYFESKLNYIIFEKENDSIIKFFKSQEKIENVIKVINFLEKPEKKDNNNNNNNNGNNKFIILFYIAYLKVVLKKYINIINDNNNDNKFENDDLRNNKIDDVFQKKSKFVESLSYFIIKLYYDIEGNFRDFISASQNYIKCSFDFDKEINENNKQKYYGFDYLLLPLKKENAKKYNEIIKIILNNLKSPESFKNDIGILSDINKNDTDIFYCVITNIFLSHLSDKYYFESNNYTILKNWFEDRLKHNKYENLNEYSKLIINKFINYTYNDFYYTKDLMNLVFALRLVLNSLSQSKNSFFFKLVANPKEIISSHQNFLKYFFYNNNNNLEKLESYKLYKFILLSHLIFSYEYLKKIDSEEFKNVTNIDIEENGNIFQILNKEIDSIIKIIRYKGIKVKFIIIYMNIVFEEIKSMKDFNIKKPELEVKYLESELTSQFYLKEIKKYFNLLKELGESEENNEFKKILYEDYDYYNNKDNIEKKPYLNYFTTPNLCTTEDFEYQYISSMERHPIIEFILKGKENEIISIMNSLPRINLFINNIYNKKVFSISREEAENEKVEDLNLDEEEIQHFNKDISSIIKDYEISKDSNLLEVLNIKNNKIYKLYEDIIKLYNKFLKQLTIYNNNKDFLLPFIVQDFSNEISLFKNPEEGLNELKRIISIYSKRNRLILDDKNYKLNVYNGDKIDYDFQLIENILEKKYFIDKNIFEQNQRTFIFSNNVFSDERKNILKEIMEKYPQEPIKNNEKFSEIESDDKDFNIKIYHDLQFIIINLQSLLINNEKENISFKNISELMKKKYGYDIEESLHIDDIYVNNILSAYEKYEDICFDYFKDILIPENLINEKDETIKDYLDKLELIKIDVISKATKKYLMRYCLGDYDKKENIFKNMKIEKIFLKKDIWEEKIFIDPKFKEECEKLIKLNKENDYYLDKYFLYNIINDGKIERKSSSNSSEKSKEKNEYNDDNNEGNTFEQEPFQNNDDIEKNNEIETSENEKEGNEEGNDDDGFNYDDEN